jgi:hypothetical protein
MSARVPEVSVRAKINQAKRGGQKPESWNWPMSAKGMENDGLRDGLDFEKPVVSPRFHMIQKARVANPRVNRIKKRAIVVVQ